jgi:thioredoxin 1
MQLIDFYADWCGPCKVMAPIFEELEKEYAGKIEFKRVDVEAEGEMAARFGVQSIPTFVLVKDDKEVDRKIGAMPKEIVKKWLSGYIKG